MLDSRPFRCCVILILALVCAPVAAQRKRVRLDDGWCFTRGDAADLCYDVRPAVVRSADGKVADAPPEAADTVRAGGAGTFKPWILPSANGLIADPMRHAGAQALTAPAAAVAA